MNIIKLWNLYADGDSQWDSLTEGEKLMFAMSLEREECAKIAFNLEVGSSNWNLAALTIGKAIQARGEQYEHY